MQVNQPHLLVVDDDETQIRFLSSILQSNGFQVTPSSDGVEALKILKSLPSQFAAVITDRYMPKMDGIVFLSHIKENDALQNMPIIMQTSANSDQDIRSGFQAGAHFYLTKPVSSSNLVSVVSSALSFANRHRTWQSLLRAKEHPISLLQSGLFYFKTLEDCHGLATLLANSFPNPKMAVLGLLEMMINAIEHGNLGITYEEKTELAAQGVWLDEIEKRQKHPHYQEKVASLHFSHEGDRLVVFIRDQGEGFEHEKFKEFDPKRVFDPHGRGIMVARTMSFDQVIYTDGGRSVSCIKNIATNN